MMLRNHPRSTEAQTCHKLENSGTPDSLSIVKQVVQNCELRPRKKPLFQNQHLQAQLKFAAAHMERPSWEMFYGQMRQRLSYLATITRGMFEGKWMRLSNFVSNCSIMMWGCFALSHTGTVHKVDGIIKYMKSAARQFKLGTWLGKKKQQVSDLKRAGSGMDLDLGTAFKLPCRIFRYL